LAITRQRGDRQIRLDHAVIRLDMALSHSLTLLAFGPAQTPAAIMQACPALRWATVHDRGP
jgi:hypothetical protein